MSRHKINEAFNFSYLVGAQTGSGVFTMLSTWLAENQITTEWLTNSNYAAVDLDYHGSRGDKFCSPVVEGLLEAYSSFSYLPYTPAGSYLMKMLWQRFGDNWSKRWTALQAEYEPLENYHMEETEEEDTTNTGTVGNVSTLTGSGSRSTSEETDATIDKSVYGFDSAQASPSESEEDHSETSGSETTTESQSGNNTRTDNLAGTRDRTLIRSGNIGVTTSQQMLSAELDIRTYDFYKSVFDDIDKVLTIPVY